MDHPAPRGHGMRVAPEPDRDVIASRGDVVVTGRRGRARPSAVRPPGRGSGRRRRCVALDREPVPAGDRPIDLLVDDVKARVDGATTVIHLASAFGPAVDDDPEIVAAADVEMARRVLDAAAAAGTAHVVVLSSATVYGAWPTNPVPLTEEAPLRPDPGLAFAVQKAEIERLTVRVARPAPGHDGHRAPAGHARSPTASPAGWAGPCGPPARCAAPTTTRRCSSSTSTTSSRRSTWPPASASTACTTWPPTAGSRRPSSASWPAAPRRCGCPAGSSTGSPTCAGGSGSAPRRRPACSPTPAGRGWSPTTGSRRPAGSPPSATTRPTWARCPPARSPRSARAAARSSRSAPPASLAAGAVVGAVALVRRARRRRCNGWRPPLCLRLRASRPRVTGGGHAARRRGTTTSVTVSPGRWACMQPVRSRIERTVLAPRPTTMSPSRSPAAPPGPSASTSTSRAPPSMPSSLGPRLGRRPREPHAEPGGAGPAVLEQVQCRRSRRRRSARRSPSPASAARWRLRPVTSRRCRPGRRRRRSAARGCRSRSAPSMSTPNAVDRAVERADHARAHRRLGARVRRRRPRSRPRRPAAGAPVGPLERREVRRRRCGPRRGRRRGRVAATVPSHWRPSASTTLACWTPPHERRRGQQRAVRPGGPPPSRPASERPPAT